MNERFVKWTPNCSFLKENRYCKCQKLGCILTLVYNKRVSFRMFSVEQYAEHP